MPSQYKILSFKILLLLNENRVYKGKVKTHNYIDKISQQPENCDNRKGMYFVQLLINLQVPAILTVIKNIFQ
jgi:hypothetical protein